MARTPDTGRGDAVRRWLRALPATTRRLVLAGVVLGWLALWYALLLAMNTWLLDEPGWAEPLSSMVGPLVGIALVLWLRRRTMGSLGRVWEFDRAARRGRLPDDADPAEWAALLERAHRFQQRARTLSLGFTLVVLIATVLVSASVGYGWGVVVVIALIGSALVVLLEFAGRRQSARIDRLEEQVRSLRSS